MSAHAREVHGWRRGLRWSKRIALGLVAIVAIAIAGALVFVNTDTGRETIRAQVEATLQKTFTGGATIGKLEGNVLGEIVVRDVVINGPDRKPAITIGTLRARVRLLDLVRKDVRLDELIAEDIDVQVKRDASGAFEMAQLLTPSDPSTPPSKSTWNLDFPAVEVHRAHVRVDTGSPDAGIVNLDDLAIVGNAHVPARGARGGAVVITATWRERQAPIAIRTSLSDDLDSVSVPLLEVRAGEVSVTGKDLLMTRRAGRMPGVAGDVQVLASKAAVAALVPRVQLPADLALEVVATAVAEGQPVPIAITAGIGPTPVHVHLTADLDARHAIGKLDTGDFDLAALTGGKVVAIAGVAGDFDVMPGADGELPVATLRLGGHGTFGDIPRSEFTLAVDTRGQHVTTALDVTGAATATIKAELDRAADAIALTSASIVASTSDPAKSSGGKAPVHGQLDVSLTAHGALTPELDLAVAGTVKGKRLRVQDLSVATLELAIDARQLPASPAGKAKLRATDIVRGDMQLGALDLAAASRADGRVQVDVTSHPKQADWLVELAALVTPPRAADPTIVVDIQRHRIRAGKGGEWSGSSGHLVVGPTTIELRGLRSQSTAGRLALDGSFVKAGARAGDLTAKLDATKLTAAALGTGYAGLVDAHVDVARRGGAWAGHVGVSGKGLTMKPQGPPIDLDTKIDASAGKVTAAVKASNRDLGSIALDLALAAPARLEDAAAWKAKGREAIEKLTLELDDIDVTRVAEMAGIPSADTTGPKGSPGIALITAGRLSGSLDLSPTTAAGKIALRGLRSPKLRGVRAMDADLELAQTGAGELSPTLTVNLAEVGKAKAQAVIGLPARMFDPAAWKQLGAGALHGAQITTDTIVIDPALLARLQIASTLRGKAHFQLDVAPGLASVKVAAVVDDLRGVPIARPVSLHVDATIDDKAATAAIAMTSQGKPLTLLKIDGTIPITLDQLRAGNTDLEKLPLAATLELPKTSAPQLLNVFGRTEITTGVIDGKVTLAGTVGAPTVAAHLVGTDLGVPPGPRGKPIRTVQEVAIDASWTAQGGKLTITGTEDRGGKLSIDLTAPPFGGADRRAQVPAIGASGSLVDLARATAKVTATTFDMTPLLAFAPGPAGGAQGTLDANLTVVGFDPATAQVLGELHLHDARVPLAPALGTLRKAEIDILIHAHDIAVDATGKLGSGDVTMKGSIALDGVSLTGGQAKITLRKVSPIGAVEPAIDADIDAKIARKGAVFTADLVVDHGFVKIGSTSGEKLKPVGMPSDLVIANSKEAKAAEAETAGYGPRKQGAPPPPTSPTIVANVTLHSTKVESEEFRTTIAGKLRITADADTIGMTGQIAAQGGDLDLFDRRYRIERAAVNFDGTIDPHLDVSIAHDFPDVTTTTAVRGRMSKPQLVLTANPGTYSQSQLLGFLLGGEPGGDPTSGSARDKATDAGTSFIANKIGGYMKKALPFDIDVIRYEAASVSSSAAITVGSWITHTLFFAFRQHLDARPDENSGEGTIEYWLTKRLEVEGTAGDRSYDGVDVLWRKRF